MRFLQLGACALARVPASEADVLMMQDREQPGPKVGALLPQVYFPEGSGEAVLDEIVCGCDIARQNSRITRQTRN
jgi:hypothetical protein